MAKGWIRIHRQIQECGIWKDKEPFDRRSAWIDLILMANYEEKTMIIKGKPVIIQRGQRFTSTLHLAERWNWSVNRVRRFLELLESLQMVTTDRTTNGITVTIVKYNDYQIQRITDESTDETVDEITDGIADETTDGIQVNKINKEKERKKETKNIYGEYKHVRLTKSQFDRLCNDYGESKTLEAIKYLDEYIQMSGKKYQDHNLTMRKWVFDAVERDKQQKKGGKTSEQSKRRIERDSRTDAEREAEARAAIEYSKSEEGRREDEDVWADYYAKHGE